MISSYAPNTGTIFQSTPSAWRETQSSNSISQLEQHFNPLPPHGGRPHFVITSENCMAFQSTPSAWRETDRAVFDLLIIGVFQSTPSAWRETPHASRWIRSSRISIHSLRMEGDFLYLFWVIVAQDFNPLPPHGGRLLLCDP